MQSYGDSTALYSHIFSFVLPCSPFFVPLMNYTLGQLGLVGQMQLITGCGLLYGALVFIPVLQVQLLTFLCFVMFRSFLYATIGIYIAEVFGLATNGRVAGAVYTVAAMACLAQFPATDLTNEVFHGDLRWVNLFQLAICLPLPFLVERLQLPSTPTDRRGSGESTPLLHSGPPLAHYGVVNE